MSAPETLRPPRLAVVEVWDAEGRLQQVFDVQAWPVRLGRALDNDLLLHDTRAAAHHAVLDVDAEGAVMLQALAGAELLDLPAPGPGAPAPLAAEATQRLAPLQRWRVGQHVLRVRTLADPLPQAEPAHGQASPEVHRALLPLLSLAMLALLIGNLWIGLSPDATWQDYLPAMLSTAAGFVAWALVWGLLTKLFSRHFTWLPHLRVALVYALCIAVVDVLLAVLAFALDMPWLSRIRQAVSVVLGALLISNHLRLALPVSPRRIAAVVGVLAGAGLLLQMALQYQRDGRLFSELYATALPPPTWRLVEPRSPKALLDEVKTLEAPLQEAVRKAEREDPGGD